MYFLGYDGPLQFTMPGGNPDDMTTVHVLPIMTGTESPDSDPDMEELSLEKTTTGKISFLLIALLLFNHSINVFFRSVGLP